MADYFTIPTECPACFHPTSIEGDFLYCRNKKCPTRLFSDLKVWVDRLGLLHWGDALLTSLSDSSKPGAVKSVADLYKLSETDLEDHCSGMKMARKCWKVLHDNMSIPPEVVLAGMNIPNLGLSTATDIVKAGYDTIDKVCSMSTGDLLTIPNIGAITANQIKSGIDAKAGLLAELDTLLSIKPASTGPLSGKKICITGDVWAPRKAVQKMIVSAGGQAVDSVSKDTSALVCEASDSSSSKSKKAKQHNIPIISGADLKRILDEESTWEEIVGK